jgi:hypothetical protein
MCGEVVQQAELQSTELHMPSGDANGVRRGIDVEIAALKVVSLWQRFVAPQQGTKSSDEFTHAERFGDVIV